MKILFLTNRVTDRLVKQLKALKYCKNFHTTLISIETVQPWIKNICDEVLVTSSSTPYWLRTFEKYFKGQTAFEEECRRNISMVLKERSFDLIHLHMPPVNPLYGVFELTNLPILVDLYDPYRFYSSSKILSKKEVLSEKLALENCAGIVSKFDESLFKQYMLEGVNCLSKPILYWADYCDAKTVNKNYKTKINKPVHLIYAGVASYSIWPKFFAGNNQYMWSTQCLAKQGFKVSLYSSIFKKTPMSNMLNSEYIKLMSKSDLIQFFDYVPPDVLREQMKNADFGLQLHDFSSTGHHKIFAQTSFGNKFFAYLEAGLPIIVNDELKNNANWVKENNVGITIPYRNIADLSYLIKHINFEDMKHNIYKLSVGDLSLQENSKRLEGFYKRWA